MSDDPKTPESGWSMSGFARPGPGFDRPRQRLKDSRPFILFWLSALVAVLAWRTVPLLDTVPFSQARAGSSWMQHNHCLSYAPFREPGVRPDRAGVHIPPERLRQDLQQIAKLGRCVRLYGTANGLHEVPELARQLGLRVWLGVWLGSDVQLNAAEMERASRLLNTHADVIDRVVVGSEVLLRGELGIDPLTGYLSTMQSQTALPVTYADVWEFWLQYADALIPFVDEATIHVLPYWENTPVGADAAADHVRDVWHRVHKRLSPLPVVIGETGWPTAGRARGAARPGLAEQRLFLDAVTAADFLEARPPLNLIEAFNQPWKASLEGTAGAAWGILDPGSGGRGLLAGVLLVMVCLMAVVVRECRVRMQRIGQVRLQGQSSVAAGAVLEVQADGKSEVQVGVQSGMKSDGHSEGFGHLLLMGLLASAAMGLMAYSPAAELRLLDGGSREAIVRMAALAGAVGWALLEYRALLLCASGALPFDSTRMMRFPSWIREVGLWTAAAYTLLLVGDGRYCDLAWPLVWMPLVPMMMRVWVLGVPDVRSRMALARAGLLAGSAVAIVQVETWGNVDAVLVAVGVLLMGMTSVKGR